MNTHLNTLESIDSTCRKLKDILGKPHVMVSFYLKSGYVQLPTSGTCDKEAAGHRCSVEWVFFFCFEALTGRAANKRRSSDNDRQE